MVERREYQPPAVGPPGGRKREFDDRSQRVERQIRMQQRDE